MLMNVKIRDFAELSIVDILYITNYESMCGEQ